MGGSAFKEGLYPGGLYPGGSANRWVCLQEGGLQGGWIDSQGLPQTWVCIQGRSAPLQVGTAIGGHCSSRYASYWNALLVFLKGVHGMFKK